MSNIKSELSVFSFSALGESHAATTSPRLQHRSSTFKAVNMSNLYEPYTSTTTSSSASYSSHGKRSSNSLFKIGNKTKSSKKSRYHRAESLVSDSDHQIGLPHSAAALNESNISSSTSREPELQNLSQRLRKSLTFLAGTIDQRQRTTESFSKQCDEAQCVSLSENSGTAMTTVFRMQSMGSSRSDTSAAAQKLTTSSNYLKSIHNTFCKTKSFVGSVR